LFCYQLYTAKLRKNPDTAKSFLNLFRACAREEYHEKVRANVVYRTSRGTQWRISMGRAVAVTASRVTRSRTMVAHSPKQNEAATMRSHFVFPQASSQSQSSDFV